MILKNIFSILVGKNLKKTVPNIFNFGSLTYLIVLFNILGKSNLSILLSLVQSFLIIITLGLSGNFRSIILSKLYKYDGLVLLRIFFYLILICLIFFGIFYLRLITQYSLLMFLLIARKLHDWIEELLLIKVQKQKKETGFLYLAVQASFLIPLPFIDLQYLYGYIIIWIVSTSLIFFTEYSKIFRRISSINISDIKSNHNNLTVLFATILPTLANYIFRYAIKNEFESKIASIIISSITLGTLLWSFLILVLLPDFISELRKNNNLIELSRFYFVSFTVISLIFVSLTIYCSKDLLYFYNLDYKIALVSLVAGFLLLISNVRKQFLIQGSGISSLSEEIEINLVFVLGLVSVLGLHFTYDRYFFYPALLFFHGLLSVYVYESSALAKKDKKKSGLSFSLLVVLFLIFFIYISTNLLISILINFNLHNLKLIFIAFNIFALINFFCKTIKMKSYFLTFSFYSTLLLGFFIINYLHTYNLLVSLNLIIFTLYNFLFQKLRTIMNVDLLMPIITLGNIFSALFFL